MVFERYLGLVYFAVFFTTTLLILLVLRVFLKKNSPTQKIFEKEWRDALRDSSLNNWEKAEKKLTRLWEKGHKTPEAALELALSCRGLKKYAKALNVLEEAISHFPERKKLLVEKANLLFEMGRIEEALPIFHQNERLLTESDLFNFISTLLQNEKYAIACSILDKNKSLVHSTRFLALAGDAYLHLEHFGKASEFYKQALEKGWVNHSVLTKQAHCLKCLGRLGEAKKYFRYLMMKDSEDIGACLGLGACFEQEGDYTRALNVYKGSSRWEEKDPRLLLRGGICYNYLGEYQKAHNYLLEAVNKGIVSAQVLTFLGYSLEAQKEWEQAQAWYLRLVEAYPNHPAGYRALAWLFGVGLSVDLTPEEGLSFAHRSVDLMPDAISWELLSACEARAGNFDRAHTIQERLSTEENDQFTKMRRQKAMRALRKRQPLNDQLVSKVRVA